MDGLASVATAQLRQDPKTALMLVGSRSAMAVSCSQAATVNFSRQQTKPQYVVCA